MNDSFNYLMTKFLLNYSEMENKEEIKKLSLYTQKRLSTEFRKILDKIALEIIYDAFENEEFIRVLLSLHRVERIIIVFGLLLGMSNTEVAFLLNTNKNSVYVQAIKKYILDRVAGFQLLIYSAKFSPHKSKISDF